MTPIDEQARTPTVRAPAPYYQDSWLTVYHGDAAAVLAGLPVDSVHCVVTSPPYWGLRDYGEPDQLGLEATPEAYVAALVAVFREVRRVLRADGTVWLNLGDSYASGKGHAPQPAETLAGGKGGVGDELSHRGRPTAQGSRLDARDFGMKPKDRVMIPARVALALQADGWWLRDEIVWSKPNPMPSSVKDRTTPSHEMVYLLAKSERYWYDGDAIKEPMAASLVQRINQPSFDSQTGGPKDYANGTNPNQSARKALENVAKAHRRTPAGWNVNHDESDKLGRYEQRRDKQAATAATSPGASGRTMAGFNDRWDETERRNPTWAERKAAGAHAGGHGGGNLEGSGTQRNVHGEGMSHDLGSGLTRNKRSVWHIPSQAYPAAHFATFPEALIEPMILAGCPEGGVVLDPFAGSGTTGLVSQRLSRRAVLIDLSMDYLGQLMDRNRDIPLGLETA